MTHKQSHKWIDDLQKLTQSYNNTYRRSIKKAPARVTNDDNFDFRNRQQQQTDNIKPVKGYRHGTG